MASLPQVRMVLLVALWEARALEALVLPVLLRAREPAVAVAEVLVRVEVLGEVVVREAVVEALLIPSE